MEIFLIKKFFAKKYSFFDFEVIDSSASKPLLCPLMVKLSNYGHHRSFCAHLSTLFDSGVLLASCVVYLYI